MYFCLRTVVHIGMDLKAILGTILKDYCPVCSWKLGAIPWALCVMPIFTFDCAQWGHVLILHRESKECHLKWSYQLPYSQCRRPDLASAAPSSCTAVSCWSLCKSTQTSNIYRSCPTWDSWKMRSGYWVDFQWHRPGLAVWCHAVKPYFFLLQVRVLLAMHFQPLQ